MAIERSSLRGREHGPSREQRTNNLKDDDPQRILQSADLERLAIGKGVPRFERAPAPVLGTGQIGADRSQISARSLAGASHDVRFIAVLTKLTRENACGKLPASRFWRMAHHATVLTTKGKSYRMREEPS